MATLKLIVGGCLMPLPIAALLGCGAIALYFLHRRRAAGYLAAAALSLCLLCAFGPFANALLRPLESEYPSVLNPAQLPQAPQYVVVLGSGYHARTGLPITSALDAEGVVRLAEGIRLWRCLPGTTLVLSGGSIRGEAPIAAGYGIAAEALGVPSRAIVLSATGVDTSAEMHALRDHLGDAPVLLVTSAAHMPRAMRFAKSLGVHAIAAPTASLVDPVPHPALLPSGSSLRKTETALHEYLGLLAMGLGLD